MYFSQELSFSIVEVDVTGGTAPAGKTFFPFNPHLLLMLIVIGFLLCMEPTFEFLSFLVFAAIFASISAFFFKTNSA